MWNGKQKFSFTAETLTNKKLIRRKTKCRNNQLIFSVKRNFINACETECASEPNLALAEPPKQLKLEQFLQQLSNKSFSKLQQGNIISKPVQTTENMAVNSTLKLTLSNSTVFPKKSSTVVSSSDTVTASGIVTCTSKSANYPNYSSEKHQHEVLLISSKNKRNTTSTTTSGHGTISEGDSSSVLDPLVFSPGVCSKSIKSSGTSAGTNSATSNSVSTPGSGSGTPGLVSRTGVGLHQRNPASSGYESTIQDDDELFENDHFNGNSLNKDKSSSEITGGFGSVSCFDYSKRKKKKRVWIHKLEQYKQNHNSELDDSTDSVTIRQPTAICLDVNGITTMVVDAKNENFEFLDQPNSDSNACSFFCCYLKKST